MLIVCALVGCGPTYTGVEELELETVQALVPPLPEMEPYDYRTCNVGAIVAPCDDASCIEPGSETLFKQFMTTVERHELDDYIQVSDARVDSNFTGDSVIAYQVHVGWVRSAHSLRFAADVSDEERARVIDETLSELELPLTLATPKSVREAVASCLPEIPFNPCTAFRTATSASVLSATWYARVDTKTGTLTQCGPD